jgi:recombination protein RecA
MGDWKSEVETEFGKDVFYSSFGEEVISSGSLVVDFLTGIGGFPLGGVIEICGTEGSGKTTLAVEAVKVALREKRPVLWLDFERSVGKVYLRKLGVDFSLLKDYLVSPKSMEDGWMLMHRFCESPTHRGGLIVVDSVAAMPPVADLEKIQEIIGHVRIASQAYVMSNAFRQMIDEIRKAGVCVVFTNQERSTIDTTGRMSAPKTTPGGAALKFYSALRLKLEVRASIKETQENVLGGSVGKEIVTALEVVVTVLKNKLAPSYRRGSIYVRMDEGIDNLMSALKLAENLGLIQKKGSYYIIDQKYSGDTLGGKKEHGFDRVRKYFLDSPEVMNLLLEDVKGYLESKSKLIAKEV